MRMFATQLARENTHEGHHADLITNESDCSITHGVARRATERDDVATPRARVRTEPGHALPDERVPESRRRSPDFCVARPPGHAVALALGPASAGGRCSLGRDRRRAVTNANSRSRSLAPRISNIARERWLFPASLQRSCGSACIPPRFPSCPHPTCGRGCRPSSNREDGKCTNGAEF